MIGFFLRAFIGFVILVALVAAWFLVDVQWNDGEVRVRSKYGNPAARIRESIDEEMDRQVDKLRDKGVEAVEKTVEPLRRKRDEAGDEISEEIRKVQLKPPVEEARREIEKAPERLDQLPEESSREIERLIEESMQ